MKKLWFLSVFVVPLIALVLFTGCPSSSGGGGGGQGSGSFTYDSTTYSLTNASIDDYQDGYFELYIASSGIDAYEWTGIGDIISFYLESPTGAIAAGTYALPPTDGYVFWGCDMGINFDTATLTGTLVRYATSGSITLSISGSTYTVDFNLTMDDANTVTGSYTGTVSIWYP